MRTHDQYMRSGQHFKNKIENNDKILELAA